MSQRIDQPAPTEPNPAPEDPAPQDPALEEPALEEPETQEAEAIAPLAHWALSIGQLALLALLGLMFLVLCYVPLRGTDLWVHVNQGSWILEHRSLPTEDPFMPLSEGMEVQPHAWLGQVLLAASEKAVGAEGLTVLFALVVTATYLVLGRVFFLAGGRLAAMVLALAVTLGVGWSRVTTIRPESFAALCFALLLWWLASKRHLMAWIGVPLVMALWANLHGSVVVGLAVLGCLAAGTLIDSAWQTRSLGVALRSTEVRRPIWLFWLGLFAVLINPQRIDLLVHVLFFADNPNLAGVLEWQPLSWTGIGGRAVLLSWLLLLLLLRHSRRRVPAAHVLLLLGFGWGALQGIRMLTWYAPVVALVMAPHFGELLERWSRPAPRWLVTKSPVLTMIAFLGVFIVFSFSPPGNVLLGGEKRSPEALYDRLSTPLGVSAHLQSAAAEGLVLAPQWWADFLVHEGPPGLQPMVTSNIHLVPRQVWLDYERITNVQTGWQSALDRYRIDTVVADRATERRLVRDLGQLTGWRETYRDPQAVVFVRGSGAEAGNAVAPETDEGAP